MGNRFFSARRTIGEMPVPPRCNRMEAYDHHIRVDRLRGGANLADISCNDIGLSEAGQTIFQNANDRTQRHSTNSLRL